MSTGSICQVVPEIDADMASHLRPCTSTSRACRDGRRAIDCHACRGTARRGYDSVDVPAMTRAGVLVHEHASSMRAVATRR